ncbi:MAG: hypothetical protein JSR82_02685 [Verrucomicrobia bacterium]|nr:hypothetical protein [Verrucomicrobiota bacterium]
MNVRSALLSLTLLAAGLPVAAFAQPAPTGEEAIEGRRPFREQFRQRMQERFQRRFGQEGGPGARGGMMAPGMQARREFMQSLSPEDRQRLRAARLAAFRDPQVQAALQRRQAEQRAFQQTMKEAVKRADPSVAPLIDRLEKTIQDRRAQQFQGLQRRLDFLSTEERGILLQARRAVQADPALAAARQQGLAIPAGDAAARQQALRVYHETMKNAMIRQDPRVGPILEKIRQQQKGGR